MKSYKTLAAAATLALAAALPAVSHAQAVELPSAWLMLGAGLFAFTMLRRRQA